MPLSSRTLSAIETAEQAPSYALAGDEQEADSVWATMLTAPQAKQTLAFMQTCVRLAMRKPPVNICRSNRKEPPVLATVWLRATQATARYMAMPMLWSRASRSQKMKKREALGAKPTCRQSSTYLVDASITHELTQVCRLLCNSLSLGAVHTTQSRAVRYEAYSGSLLRGCNRAYPEIQPPCKL